MNAADMLRYQDQGFRAVEIHPDYSQMDFETAASDMVASIMHAVRETLATNGTYPRDFDPGDFLDAALRMYYADLEA